MHKDIISWRAGEWADEKGEGSFSGALEMQIEQALKGLMEC